MEFVSTRQSGDYDWRFSRSTVSFPSKSSWAAGGKPGAKCYRWLQCCWSVQTQRQPVMCHLVRGFASGSLTGFEGLLTNTNHAYHGSTSSDDKRLQGVRISSRARKAAEGRLRWLWDFFSLVSAQIGEKKHRRTEIMRLNSSSHSKRHRPFKQFFPTVQALLRSPSKKAHLNKLSYSFQHLPVWVLTE